MHNLEEIISVLKEKEKNLQKTMQDFSKYRNLKNLDSFPEKKLVFPVQKEELRGKIAGVDSGFVDFNFSHLQLIAVRAIAAIHTFDKALSSYSYYPNYYIKPKLFYTEKTIDNNDLTLNKNLVRLKEEISTAIKVVESFSPSFLLLDGSIIPQYSEKPSQNSKLKKEYEELIHLFETLYSLSEKNNTLLVGCVEDSRGTRFTDILSKEINKPISLYDSQFLNYFLNPGERTSYFNYTPEKHPVLDDFDEKYQKSIFVFYLKSGLDKPLRLEFLKPDKVNKIASTILSLSSIHRIYSYPSVLIEADLRARLKPKEVDFIFKSVVNRVGANILLRRARRPF